MLARVRNLAVALTSGAVLLASLPVGAATMMTTKVSLRAQNGSGEAGTATLTAMGSKTKVVVALTGAPAGPQPAHIHMGTCATLNPAPAYALTSLTNGKSTTVVNVSLSSLMAAKFAINVHKSVPEAKVYVSCGNIASMTGGMHGYGGMGSGSMGSGSMGSGSMGSGSMASPSAMMSPDAMMSPSAMMSPHGAMSAPSTTSTPPVSQGPGTGGGTQVGPLATPGAMSTGPATQATGPASAASHSP